jgi:CelD/BcsL family acetyltransferase involved in cellulose biosynthesis
MTDQNPNESSNGSNHPEEPTFTEQIEVTGNQLVERVKQLIEEGNVRRIIIRGPEGHVLMELPLSIGVAGGAALLWLAAPLAAIAAIAALVAKVTIEIVREVEPAKNGEGEDSDLPPRAE